MSWIDKLLYAFLWWLVLLLAALLIWKPKGGGQ